MSQLEWYQSKLQCLQISGKETQDFLHRLTTQNFKNFSIDEQKYAALLQPNSQILHLFLALHPEENIFELWTLPEKVEKLKTDLEKMHFAEDLKFEIKNDFKIIHDNLPDLKRVDLGLFDFGKDVTEKTLLLEIPFDAFLANQKGCYPGQEVVERVFTYGKVAKKLVWIDTKNISGNDVLLEGKKIGQVSSFGSTKVFAYVQKPYYESMI